MARDRKPDKKAPRGVVISWLKRHWRMSMWGMLNCDRCSARTKAYEVALEQDPKILKGPTLNALILPTAIEQLATLRQMFYDGELSTPKFDTYSDAGRKAAAGHVLSRLETKRKTRDQ